MAGEYTISTQVWLNVIIAASDGQAVTGLVRTRLLPIGDSYTSARPVRA